MMSVYSPNSVTIFRLSATSIFDIITVSLSTPTITFIDSTRSRQQSPIWRSLILLTTIAATFLKLSSLSSIGGCLTYEG
ncbi:hypothetical protein EDD85DRAFT_814764 [Armillaria nabsnona]|nr:hypothetical protein EDD85DRAFT_814764 [Armillaria nabsnona]